MRRSRILLGGILLTMCDKHKFIFEWDKAYTAQLISKFEASPEHPLTENVAPHQKGVHQRLLRV